MTNKDLVNRLVKKSFGIMFRGDWANEIDSFDDRIEKADNPNQIAKRFWFPIPYVLEMWKYAGKFTNNEGSALTVTPDFRIEAEKYCQLYKIETGKDVEVFYSDKIELA